MNGTAGGSTARRGPVVWEAMTAAQTQLDLIKFSCWNNKCRIITPLNKVRFLSWPLIREYSKPSARLHSTVLNSSWTNDIVSLCHLCQLAVPNKAPVNPRWWRRDSARLTEFNNSLWGSRRLARPSLSLINSSLCLFPGPPRGLPGPQRKKPSRFNIRASNFLRNSKIRNKF